MHACHDEVVGACVLEHTTTAGDGLFFVHIEVSAILWVRLLKCQTVHEIADDEQLATLEDGMTWSMAYGIDAEDIAWQCIAKAEEM